jgi:hypothetical protein
VPSDLADWSQSFTAHLEQDDPGEPGDR